MSRSAFFGLLALAALVAGPVPAYGAPPMSASHPPMSAIPPTAAEATATLWDYDHPEATEARFRGLLGSKAAEEPAFRLEVETQLARTFSLRAKFEEAHRILDGVEQGLRGQDVPRVRVRYLLERGRCFNSDKAPARALPLFREAWDVARAAKLDGLAVDAAHMVAIAEADPKAQERWNREAIAYAEASPDPEAKRWLGSLLNNLAWALHDGGRPEEALALFEKGLAWHRERKTGEGEFIARYMVARCQRTLGRHEEALAGQQALLADRALAAAEPDGYVEEEIAENLLALGRKAEARPHFARAHALLAKDVWLGRNEPARLARLAELARE
jgi:tetratricopeptide (TPR) repeat protein